MKKRVYSRPVCVTLSETMFNQLEVITREREISLSEYIREAVQDKFEREINPKESNSVIAEVHYGGNENDREQ